MGVFKICKKDPLVKLLRENYDAIPLKNPETRVRPLDLFGWKNKKAFYLGSINYYLNEGANVVVSPQSSTVSDLAGKKTKTIDITVGLNLLSGFLKGLGADANPLSASFKGVKKTSFSFKNPVRDYIIQGELGKAIQNRVLDIENPALGLFTDPEEGWKLMVINSAFVSSDFSFHFEKTVDSSYEVKVEVIKGVLSEVNAKVDVDTSQEKTVSFKGTKSLTFAFTAFELEVDWKTGKIKKFYETRKDAPIPLSRDNDLFIWD